ncbi:MAG: esterase-like activity of phytase family protein, partial [Caldilineaceae bacterium]
GGVDGITQDAVTQVTFESFNESGVDPLVRVFGPNATVAQDLEPEYVAVSADSATAWVTLQENNAVAAIDLAAGEVLGIVPLGFKDHSRPFVLGIEDFEVQGMEVLGQTPAGQDVLMGGLSGLWFEGLSEDGASLIFVTHTDRGPNADPTDVDGDGSDERPFVLADFQPRILRLAQSLEDGSVTILETIGLSDADGLALTGLPNLADGDERPVDLLGAELEYDALGGDFEAVVVADDGSFWMADEYRPSIYHFAPDGVLIDRFVPEGANDNEAEVEVGTDVLPETLATRRANRGFEALALDGSILYAFVQSPLDNPESEGDANSKAGRFIRIVAFDTASGETVGQYLYELVGDAVDKIGDAVVLGDGEFL